MQGVVLAQTQPYLTEAGVKVIGQYQVINNHSEVSKKFLQLTCTWGGYSEHLLTHAFQGFSYHTC